MPKIDELTFVRAIDPAVVQAIPRYLFEQIKDMDEQKIEMIYGYATSILTVPAVNAIGQIVSVPNPLIWMVIMHDVSHQIKGFLWAKIDIIERRIFVQACSVDRDYQGTNGAVEKRVVDYLFGLPIPDDLKQKIVMSTSRPKACEKHGWHRSKKVLMEIENVA